MRNPANHAAFLGELRQYAMRLHTREQAPREGKAAAPKPDKPWEPKLAGYMQFMAESKVVYDTFEELLAAGAQPYYKEFAATGLQRGAAIDHDLAYLSEKYGVPIPEAKPDGPGHTYASELRELAANKPGPFLCHFYNHYFAHTAGGRMIGKQVSQRILDGWTGNFYKWDGNVKDMLDDVRGKLESVAQTWSDEEKHACLEETAATFSWGGKLLRLVAAD